MLCDFGMLGDANSKHFPAKHVAMKEEIAVIYSFSPQLIV